MPNGGSDCCRTCWFNAKNNGEAGYKQIKNAAPNYCTIRQLEIHSASYTYCANHPDRSPDKFTVPIGPVFMGDSTGRRDIWKPAPDNEEIRLALLDLVSHISETPSTEYPIGFYRDDLIIYQLGELKEQRAVEHLQRIASFDPTASSGEPFHRNRSSTVKVAVEALQKIQENRPSKSHCDN